MPASARRLGDLARRTRSKHLGRDSLDRDVTGEPRMASPRWWTIRRNDASLAKQGRDAINSILLNVSEAGGRVGGDRLHLFRIALGSLREIGAVLDAATAHGWLDSPPLAAERDRLGGMIYSLARR